MPEEVIEKKTGDEPIVLTGDAAPEPFSWDNKLPDNLPDHLKSLSGKKFSDLADSQASLRKTLQERSDRIKELEAAAKDPTKKDDPPGEIDAQMFREEVKSYHETGDVSEEFLKAVEERGVRVDRATILKFFEWQRDARKGMVKNLSEHSKGTVTEEEVQQMMDWLESGDSPFSPAVASGFDEMYQDGNFSFFDTLSKAFGEAVQGGYRHKGFGGLRVKGKPIQTVDSQGFESAEAFQSEMLKVRADPKLSPFERRQAQHELVQRRRRQHGEI